MINSEPIGGRPIAAIVEQHAEEAAFLWVLRDAAVRAPHFALADLARLDGRIEAHLDGLRVAGVAGWDVARGGLAIGEPGEVFAAAVLAFEGLHAERRGAVLEAASAAPGGMRAV